MYDSDICYVRWIKKKTKCHSKYLYYCRFSKFPSPQRIKASRGLDVASQQSCLVVYSVSVYVSPELTLLLQRLKSVIL